MSYIPPNLPRARIYPPAPYRRPKTPSFFSSGVVVGEEGSTNLLTSDNPLNLVDDVPEGGRSGLFRCSKGGW